jgi:ferredoxin
VAPELFVPIDDDEWGRAAFVADAFDESDPAQVKLLNEAVISCPESAITVS